jgi:hypothetical protein
LRASARTAGSAAIDLADDGASVLLRSFGELNERRAHLDQIAFAAEQARNAPAPRRGNFDHSLVRLDGNKRLIGDDAIALVHEPGDDLRLFESFAQIGEVELAHEALLQPNWQT